MYSNAYLLAYCLSGATQCCLISNKFTWIWKVRGEEQNKVATIMIFLQFYRTANKEWSICISMILYDIAITKNLLQYCGREIFHFINIAT